jgi:phospholipid/cholesterol/gamma-HCH transport system permease protein
MEYYSLQSDKTHATLKLALRGSWSVSSLSRIEAELRKAAFPHAGQIIVSGDALEQFDTAAAWYLNDFITRLRKKHAAVEIGKFQDNHRRVFERISGLPQEKGSAAARRRNPVVALVMALGGQVADISRDSYKGAAFFGEFITGLVRRLLRPLTLRPRSVVFHVNEVGLRAAPIIALMGFALAFVTAYQGAYQLQRFDATIFTIDLVALSVMRELGVLLVAIMLAGRSGSAFAAQLGTMKLNEEVDALQTMGVSPFEALVLPRLLAILISLPLLTIIADMTGILGGYAYMSAFLDYSWLQYFSRLQEAAEIQHFYVGLSKAPFFAVLIGIVGCMQGLRASGSAEEVGRRTITAVVQSIFLVILADALFSVVFTKMDI